MDLFIKLYLTIWIILTTAWLLLIIKKRKYIVLLQKDYIEFISKKWKFILFLIATFFLSYISTFWYDPTWDIPETIIMALLTYYTAPYSSWIIYRYIKWLNKNFYELYIAIILVFFSSAWIYDIYAMIFLIWEYPLTAFANLWLSPFFYLLAGMMWNLDYRKDLGVVFVCNYKEWINFSWDENSFRKIFIYTLPMLIFMVVIFWYFIYLNL